MYLLTKLVFLLTIIGASYSCRDNHQQQCSVCPSIDNRIREIINVSLASFPEKDGSRITSLVNWTRIDNRIHEIFNEQRNCTGVVYRDHCYWLPRIVAKYGGNSGKSAAANVCRSYGATLVDIETEEQYDVLYKYIQKAWQIYVDRPTVDFVEVWLASSYTNGNVVSSQGGSVYTRWRSGDPGSDPGIAFVVGTKPTRSATSNGMFTSSESNLWPLPFCRL